MSEGPGVGLVAMPTTYGRPVFYPALGQYFVELREGRGWSQSKAAYHAARLGLEAVSRDVIVTREGWKTKFPEKEVLQGVAELYGVAYRDIATRFVDAAYDLGLHGSKAGSGTDEAPASTRVLEIARSEVQQELADALERLDAIHEDLGSVVATLRTHQKPDRARRHQARPRRVHR